MKYTAIVLVVALAVASAISTLDAQADFRPPEWANLAVEKVQDSFLTTAYNAIRRLMGFPLSQGFFVYKGFEGHRCSRRSQIFEAGVHTGMCFKVVNYTQVVGSYRLQVHQLKGDMLQVNRTQWMSGNCGGVKSSETTIQMGSTWCGKGRGVIQGVGEIHSGMHTFSHGTPAIMDVVSDARILVEYDSKKTARMNPLVEEQNRNSNGGDRDGSNPMMKLLSYRVQAVPSVMACHRARNPMGGSPLSYRTYCHVPRRSHGNDDNSNSTDDNNNNDNNMRGSDDYDGDDGPNVGSILNVWYADENCGMMTHMTNFSGVYSAAEGLEEEIYGGAHVFTPKAMPISVFGGHNGGMGRAGTPPPSSASGMPALPPPMPAAYRVACVHNGDEGSGGDDDDDNGTGGDDAPMYTPRGPPNNLCLGPECACVGPQCACSGTGCTCTGKECGASGNAGCPAQFSPTGSAIPNCNNGTAGMMHLGWGSSCAGPQCLTVGGDSTNFYGEKPYGPVCYGEGCTCSGSLCFATGPDATCTLAECKSQVLSFAHLGACRGVGCTCAAQLVMPSPQNPAPIQGCACAGKACRCMTMDCACNGPDCANTTAMTV